MMKKFTTYFALLMIIFIGIANNLNAQNQVPNPGFESWAAGVPDDWTTSGGAITLTQNTANTHGGTSSCEVVFTSQSNQSLISASFTVTPGQEINGGIWILDNDDAGRGRISVLYDGGENFYGDYSEDNAEWQELTFTETVPAGATSAQFQMRFYDVSANWVDDCEILVDDALFEVNTSVNPEPSNYPSSFSSAFERLDAEISWTDSDGTNLPSGYLLKGSISNNITAPVDGTPVDSDYDFSDGSITINVIQGDEGFNLSMQHGLIFNQDYYFKIYPFSNNGNNIDYKTDGIAPSDNGSTTDLTLVHKEYFAEDMGTWSHFSVIGDEVWEQSTSSGNSYVEMSGYNGSAVDNEDWLISPALNLSTFSNIVLSFSSAFNYSGPDLALHYSSDYSGTGDPNSATWNELTPIWSDGAFNWVGSGNIDLPSTNGISLAYKYLSNPTDGAAKWEITNILITAGGGAAAPATQLDITAINGGNAVYDNQAFTVTVQAQDEDGAAANVDADLAVTLSIGTGNGTLAGTLTGTIASGTSTITISGVTYSPHENGVILEVDGGSLTTGSSDAFNVLEVIVPEIVISEIMYKSMAGNQDSLEYIEFYNNGSSAINLENYTMTKGVVHTFGNVSIDAGGYLLLAKDADAILDLFAVSAEEWTSGGLSNGGEEIELSDASAAVVSYVDFGTSGDWPSTETGKSIRFCTTTLTNNDPVNWSISEEFIATVGEQDMFGTPLAECGAASLNANFTASETNIEEDDLVDFTDSSTGAPTSWAWTFEGGTPATSDIENPQNIVYSSAGTYDVTLVITKDTENDTEVKTDYITVTTPTNPATNLDIAAINGGNDVYENHEFSVTVNSIDAAGGPANVDADLTVTISLNTGTGTLGGILTGTILSGTNSIVISDLIYGPHEDGVKLDVNGDGLTMGTSAAFDVLEVIIPEIVITEIMYNAMPNTDTLEYIEFYNNGTTAVELENYQVTKGVAHTFEAYTLNPGAYVLLAENASAILDAFSINAIEWTSGGLSNSGEEVNLLTPSGAEVTLVDFDIIAPWPVKETGKSIRFCNAGLANNDPANWSISTELLATIGGQELYGTPLASCGVAALNAEFSASSTSIETGQSVNFTDESTGTPTSWAWTFEGGTPSSSTSQNPEDVVYNTAGVYDVVLTVSKDGDNNTETKTEYITVVDPITPPVASFTADITTIFVGQSVQFNSTSTNNPDTHAWTFEGGTPETSTIQNPSVSYTTAGIYDVSLTVANGGGSDELVETDFITVLPATLGDLVITEIMFNPPEAGDDVLEYIEIYNNSDETVDLMGYNFTAGVDYTFPTMDLTSGSYVLVAKDANAMQTTLGVTALQWTSGSLSNDGELVKLSSPTGITIDSVPYAISNPWPEDANGNGPSISICDAEVENSIGENWHASTLYLTDDVSGNAIYGSPGTAPAPVANFSADEVSIFITEDVQFTNLSSCNYTSLEWTFEGGTPSTSTDESPLVSYDVEGVYDVTLIVTNAIGSHTLVMEDYIEVIDPTIAPIADFSADLTTVFVGQSVEFTDLSENEPITYNWTFEGGSPATSSLQNPNVAYNTPGIFDVTLFVENTAGDDEMIKAGYITVLPATVGDLVITEIMYNPPESGDDSLEYIEIYNNSADIVNLLGYTISDRVEYTFPNIELAINDYLVVAKSADAMQNTLGVTTLEWTSGSLSNGGELVKIVSASGITVDSVLYSDMAPWPEDGDGAGPSITICDPEAENSVGENWHASVNYLADNTNGDAIYGSPGTAPAAVADFTANDQLPGVGDQVEFTELSTCNAETFEWTFEGGTPETSTDPNPIITYSMAGDFDVTLKVTNAIGSHTITMEEYIRVGVGIAEQTLAEISIMPNPSTGLFILENPSNNEISVIIYNVLGKLVYENKTVFSNEVIDLTREESGIYLLQLSIDGEYKTMRIIKQ